MNNIIIHTIIYDHVYIIIIYWESIDLLMVPVGISKILHDRWVTTNCVNQIRAILMVQFLIIYTFINNVNQRL